MAQAKVDPAEIAKVVCHRLVATGHEQYLVQWNERSTEPCYSWHSLIELSETLRYVQQYIDLLPHRDSSALPPLTTRKRKLDDDRYSDANSSHSESAVSRESLASSFTSSRSSEQDYELSIEAYNGTLRRDQMKIEMVPDKVANMTELPTEQMLYRATQCDTRQAQYQIRTAFDLKLSQAARGVAPLELVNQVDRSRPPLNFTFVPRSPIRKGVQVVDAACMTGCGEIASCVGVGGAMLKCRPNMGQGIGCEYGRICECLEFAAVDIPRLSGPQEKKLFDEGETSGLPKRFPYTKDGRLLLPFYLHSRHPIYECNPRCQCGSGCKTRLVQRGRTIPLQIFKTQNRGWGLRSTVHISRGQFIDTYRGEIITDAEASKREEQASSGFKNSYFYSLDKFSAETDSESKETYVVDGEFFGGPTRFINHSCEPNLRQYTVSFNKYDRRVYEIAFFACMDIPAGTELTFDYLDKDEEDDEEQEGVPSSSQVSMSQKQTPMDCYCGSKKCRGKLWI